MAWSAQWAARRAEDPAARFRWVSYEGTAVNLHVRPLLAAMTAGHCAYCDASEQGTTARAPSWVWKSRGDHDFDTLEVGKPKGDRGSSTSTSSKSKGEPSKPCPHP